MPERAELREIFVAAVRQSLNEGLEKIQHCVAQLSDEQVWWRPRAEMNSIANLMLHLSGNLRQWVVAGIGGAEDVRNRPQEFSDRSQQPKAELLKQLEATVTEADAVLARLTVDDFVSPRRIQGFDTNVTEAIFNCIPHFRGHVQEIVQLTRQQLGDKYNFYFVPQGKEQGAAE